jgi:hypothetical protein
MRDGRKPAPPDSRLRSRSRSRANRTGSMNLPPGTWANNTPDTAFRRLSAASRPRRPRPRHPLRRPRSRPPRVIRDRGRGRHRGRSRDRPGDRSSDPRDAAAPPGRAHHPPPQGLFSRRTAPRPGGTRVRAPPPRVAHPRPEGVSGTLREIRREALTAVRVAPTFTSREPVRRSATRPRQFPGTVEPVRSTPARSPREHR